MPEPEERTTRWQARRLARVASILAVALVGVGALYGLLQALGLGGIAPLLVSVFALAVVLASVRFVVQEIRDQRQRERFDDYSTREPPDR